MTDHYSSYADLIKENKQGRDYKIRAVFRDADWAIIAPHGGGIEPGTSEITEAVAGGDLSFYTFNGLKEGDNGALHITSTRFDEPEGVKLVAASKNIIAFHGARGADQVIYIGGTHHAAIAHFQTLLQESGFRVERHPSPGLQGTHPDNICNKGLSGKGVQFELSRGIRDVFMAALKNKPTKDDPFSRFVTAIRDGIKNGPF